MSRLRIVYIVSLVILAVLVVSAVLRPVTADSEYSEVSREQLLQAENSYIIQFDIKNHEGEDKNYTINVLIDDWSYSEDILIPGGRVFTYVHHIYPDRINGGEATFVIYKEGESTPMEQLTYHIDFD